MEDVSFMLSRPFRHVRRGKHTNPPGEQAILADVWLTFAGAAVRIIQDGVLYRRLM